jgi:SNF2 family DNA or RNA helicase
MEKRFFAIGLHEHRLWGWIFIPLILRKTQGEAFYSPEQTVFHSNTDPSYLNLSHTEKEIVKITEEYSEQELFRAFSKNKNLKEFQDNLNPENFKNFIRPFIEKRLDKILQIIRGTKIKLFLREKSRANIFEEDFLKINEEDLYPHFKFSRGEEDSFYSLVLKCNEDVISLKDQHIDILCNHPAIIRLNNKIQFIYKIEAQKLRPFFTRDQIIIPQKTEKQYFKSFVSKIVRDHEVHPNGFTIDIIKPKKKVLLSFERGFRNNAVILLKFQYGKRTLMPNSEQNVLVDFFTENNHFRFEKYFRDQEFEMEVHDQLNSLSLHSFDQVNYELRENRDLNFEDQVFAMVEWMNQNYQELKESGFHIDQKIGDIPFYKGAVELSIQSDLKNDWFDIFANVKLGEFEIPFLSLKKNIMSGTREYRLPDDTLFILPLEWFARFKELFDFANEENKVLKLHKQHFFILEKAEKGKKMNRDYSKLEMLNKPKSLPGVSLPDKLAATLRPYQEEGFTWLSYLQQQNLGGCLADDMGLGKTLQAISLLLKSAENYIPETQADNSGEPQLDLFSKNETRLTSLIVVPASLVHNWINELKKFAPSLKKLAHIGNQRSSNISKFQNYDIIISSYHTIRQDIEKISGFRFHYIILDESQVIKNPSSKIYKAVQFLNSDHRIALTGTPIENSLTDLWAQMNFINSGLLGSLNFFKREYVKPIEKKNDSNKEEKLKKLINPFILRRTKEEVARDLPEMTEQVIYCNMTDEQRKFYEEEKSSVRNSIFAQIEDQGVNKSAMIVLQGLTRLRQISNHPRLVDENFRDTSGKFEEIIRNLNSVIAEGHKALVFSSFVKHLDIIKERLEEDKIKYALLTGGSTKREDIVKAFQDFPDCKIFLISLKAGGVGLNLTAADYVFILDPWWNPASEEQAVNRAHRIGQDKNVFVFRFISANSIEEKIQTLQEKKTKLAESFVSSNNPLSNVSEEELRRLFE